MKQLLVVLAIFIMSGPALAADCAYQARNGASIRFLNDGENSTIFHHADGKDELCTWAMTDQGTGSDIACPSATGFYSFTGSGADPRAKLTFLKNDYTRTCR